MCATIVAEGEHVAEKKAAPTPRPKLRDRIVSELRAKIEDGSLPPGAQLPSESEIIAQYGVSQTTARGVVAALRGEGLIRVERGRGAYVRHFAPILRDATTRLSAQQWGAGHAIWLADLGLRPMGVDRIDVSRATAPDDVAKLLNFTDVVIRDRVYSVDGRPVQWAVSYIPADLAAGTPIERADTGPGGTYARLRDIGHEPVKFVEQVHVRMPKPEERGHLNLDVGQPVAWIRRTAATATDRVVEVNDMILVGDAYVLQWSFTS